MIARYLDRGDCETATYWIDFAFAKKSENGFNMVDFANYIKELTRVGQYKRISSLISNQRLYKKHLVFAYYYVNSLFQLRMYAEIVQLQIGHLVNTLDEDLPVKSPDSGCGLEDYFDSATEEISGDDLIGLNKMMTHNKLFSALMVVYGRTYILMENREFATRCLTAAFMQAVNTAVFSSMKCSDFPRTLIMLLRFKDRHCLVAEELLRKYRLVPCTKRDPCYRLVSHTAFVFSDVQIKKMKKKVALGDPRQRTRHAYKLYRDGNVAETLAITNGIMEEHGLYLDCVILHANCLCYFQDWRKLFLLAHEMVVSFPDHHYSWYVVAMYYFTCLNIHAARTFINKAALMRTAFGEGWIAYGHILAAESENEQALNCYYRAARILPWHYEPKMYIGMQYCRVGVRMAEDFLREASCIRSSDPVIMHERGSYYYRYNKFRTAEQFFNNALLAVIGKEEAEFADSSSIIGECLLVFRSFFLFLLKYCSIFLSKALLMNPMDWHSMASMAMSYACLGETNIATRYFAKALARAPYNGMIRNALDKLSQMENDYVSFYSVDVVTFFLIHLYDKGAVSRTAEQFFNNALLAVIGKEEAEFADSSSIIGECVFLCSSSICSYLISVLIGSSILSGNH
ncbi:tetratricopeptide repeat protein [Oesophagostomum dentatum]|uniref:Tetratricopeptide repeat protein n=1 Tax=Oesophagostomum dentatum TaxID=61180 RepID=A0A0B1TM06_OESDE|nr:tetratricopeptide repeat protein [Oesophagostomum dentatum]